MNSLIDSQYNHNKKLKSNYKHARTNYTQSYQSNHEQTKKNVSYYRSTNVNSWRSRTAREIWKKRGQIKQNIPVFYLVSNFISFESRSCCNRKAWKSGWKGVVAVLWIRRTFNRRIQKIITLLALIIKTYFGWNGNLYHLIHLLLLKILQKRFQVS